MTFKTVALIGALAAGPSAALAQQAGSMEDQVSCTPDVYRLCASLIPDEGAITHCLERNKPRLSPACKQVFSRPAPAKTPDADHESDDD